MTNSAHETTFAAAGLPALMAVHGRQVTYHAADADPTAVTAIVGPEQSEEVTRRRGRVLMKTRDVTVTAAAIAKPQLNVDQIEIDQVRYTIAVRRRTDIDDGFLRLTLRSESVIESGRLNYRDF